MTIKMANTSSEGFVSSASRRAAASGRAFRAYQTKDVDQLYRELLHKRYQIVLDPVQRTQLTVDPNLIFQPYKNRTNRHVRNSKSVPSGNI